MFIQKLRLAVAALAACAGVALAGGLVLRAQPGDPPNVPTGPLENRAGAAGPQDKGEPLPKGQIDEAARREIAGLRTRVEALEKKLMPPAPGHQKVVVTTPQVKDLAITRQYVGKIRAQRHINVCALANGVVAEVPVKEGQAVKTGDVLFKVLPSLSQAKLDAEMAEVKIVQIEFDHTKKLFDQKVVGAQEVALAEAKLARAKAKAKFAEVELAFTVVRAPFDGLVGRLQEQAGSVIKEGGTLTTLSDSSAVWVYFNVPEARYLEHVADPDRVKVGTPVELVLANGKTFPRAGKLGAIEGQFDTDTGNIPFRADFPNPDGLLRPGQRAPC